MRIFDRIWNAIKTTVAGPMSDAEVDRALTEAAAKREPLAWRHSIVDLMKLLEMDSSLDARRELAVELGYTGPLDGSAEMNTGLHKAVMEQVAKRCVEVPKE